MYTNYHSTSENSKKLINSWKLINNLNIDKQSLVITQTITHHQKSESEAQTMQQGQKCPSSSMTGNASPW